MWRWILDMIFGPKPGTCQYCGEEAMGKDYTSCLYCAEDDDECL